MRAEDPDVLADELEETEKELFDTRELYFEEVRLNMAMSDEIKNAELDAEHYKFVADLRRRRTQRLLNDLADVRDELEGERTKANKRDRWIGVALGAAFLLGGYVGFLFGCAQ